ncbi:hypothetical protein JYA63_09680 [Fictibacillus nanhaiensis]|uniref:Lipoprotein n=1 Tax=Fictibacillus nanhaiensis TaxID=742169 RepID=A0ABS2ZNT2_9BACL|nr:hypothetical protein [Fictibacillus nanhaiensis]
MKTIYLLLCMLFILFLSGCVDSSPLRSHVEVQINQAFKTKFGLIDHVIVKDLKKNETLTVLNPELFSNSLGSMKRVKIHLLNPDYSLNIKTSKESKEYSREQIKATLLYDSKKEIICTKNKKICYETSDSLRTFLIENKMK